MAKITVTKTTSFGGNNSKTKVIKSAEAPKTSSVSKATGKCPLCNGSGKVKK